MRVKNSNFSNGTCSGGIPSSCSSLRCAARFTPKIAVSSSAPVSPGIPSGWEQQVLVHMFGKVIFSAARCCKRRRLSESKRKTEKARWRRPRSMLGFR